MKRRLKIIAPLIIVLGLAAFIGSGLAIRNSARGRTFSDASTVPYRKVGVILGCSQRLSDGRANIFFACRIAAVHAGVPAEKVYCDFAGFRTLDSIVRAKAVDSYNNFRTTPGVRTPSLD